MNKPTYSEPCHSCGGDARPVRERIRVQMGTRVTSVMADHMKCSSCEEVFYLPGQMQDAQRRAADKIRADEGLLSGDQVRSIRAGLGLSQPEFERLLGVGPKTAIRWERGTVFQNAATDTLMRLLRDVRGVAEYLAADRAVVLEVLEPAAIPSASAEYTAPSSNSVQDEAPSGSPTPLLDFVEYRRLRRAPALCESDGECEAPLSEVGP